MDRRRSYRVCPYCGAALDPGERCDCQNRKPPSMLRTSRTENGINLAQPIHKYYTPFLTQNQGGKRPWAECLTH